MTRNLVIAMALLAACGRESGGVRPIDARGPSLQVSRPSDRTIAMVRSRAGLSIEVDVAAGPIRDQVVGYVHELAGRCDGVLAVREVDAASGDASLVIARGTAHERIALPRSLPSAQRELPRLDERVAHAIAKVTRPRVILLGEPARDADEQRRPLAAFARLLRLLDLPIERAVTLDPATAPDAIVVVIADGSAPSAAAMEAIDGHLARGGSALIALEPTAGVGLGPLEKRLGLRFVAEPLRSDLLVGKVRGRIDAHELVAGGVAQRHAITTMLDRSHGALVLFVSPGWLEPVAGDANPVLAIREVRGAAAGAPPGHALVAAIETAPAVPGAPRGRAVVTADASWLEDDLQMAQAGGGGGLLIDVFAWLGQGDDALPGPPALTTY